MKTDALAAARELAPTILRSRNQTEVDRRLAEPIVERLRDARLCRMALGEEIDGLEASTSAMLDVYEALAYAEASVAWIVWNNALPCFLSRYLDPKTRREIFRDPRWLYASSTRPTGKAVVDGKGYRIDGRWSLVSGCELAEWILLLCVVEENGKPRMLAPNESRNALRILAPRGLRDPRYLACRGIARNRQPRRRRQRSSSAASAHLLARGHEDARYHARPDTDHLLDGGRLRCASPRRRATRRRHARRAHEDENSPGFRHAATRTDASARGTRSA